MTERQEALHALAAETGTLSERELAFEERQATGVLSILIDLDRDTFAGLLMLAGRERVRLGVFVQRHLTRLVESQEAT